MQSTARVIQVRLPRGRHGLSRKLVEASQRTRLLEAMIQVSGERGYPAVRISDIVSRAGVARRTFYEHFESKEACFLAAYDYTAEQIISPLLAAFDPVEDLGQRVRAYIAAALQALSTRPTLARMLVIEVGGGGSAAIDHRLRMHQRIAEAIVELNRETRARGVDVPAMTRTRGLAIVGALIEVMHEAINERGPERLPALEDELTRIVATLISA